MKRNTKRDIWRAIAFTCLLYLLTHYWAWHPRFWYLQFLGHVPYSSSYPMNLDWQMAQQTWWWGRRLDPKDFWRGRPIWHDNSARGKAWRHGRGYPPMPFNDPAVADRSDWDKKPFFAIGGPDDGPVCHFVQSPREVAFWDRFTKTHPHPPASIEREQRSYGGDMVGEAYILAHDPAFAAKLHIKPDYSQKIVESAHYFLVRGLGYPPEAFTTNALFWAYVLEQRSEYQKRMLDWSNHPSVMSNHIAKLKVDPRLVTEPLSDAQIKESNAWKIDYLARLRREGVDVSYINAYLTAWQLDPGQIAEKDEPPSRQPGGH